MPMNNGAVTRFVTKKLNNIARTLGPYVMARHAHSCGLPIEVALASLRGVK